MTQSEQAVKRQPERADEREKKDWEEIAAELARRLSESEGRIAERLVHMLGPVEARLTQRIHDMHASLLAALKASQEDVQSRVRYAELAPLNAVAAVNARLDAFERRLDELEKKLLAS